MPPKHPARKLVDNWKAKDRIKHQSIMHNIEKLRENTHLPNNRAPLSKTCSIPPNAQPSPPEIRTTLKGNVTKRSDILELKRQQSSPSQNIQNFGHTLIQMDQL